jgi:hypothetical protein
VRGDGFSFQAPAGWKVLPQTSSVAAVDGPIDRLEVLRFTLEKPYRPALFVKASRELDGVVDRLAAQLKGHVADRRTTAVGGRKSRSYRIVFGPGKTEEIAFVLDGSNEFQVLCRRASTTADTTCAQLFSTFALT